MRGGGAAGVGVLTILPASMVGSGGESPGPALNVLFFVPALGALGIVAHGVYDALFVSGRSVNAHNGALNRSGFPFP